MASNTKKNFRWTVFSVTSCLVIIGAILYLIVDYDNLARGEGWGIATMIYVIGLGLAGLAADIIIRMIVQHDRTVNIFEAFCIIMFCIYLFIAWIKG